MGRRGLLIALTLGACLVGGLLGARAFAFRRAEAALAAQGLRWQGREEGLVDRTWTGLSGPGLVARELRLELLPRARVQVEGLDIDLAELRPLDAGGGGGGGGPAFPLAVDARELRLRLGEQALVEGLSGSLLPALDLRGEGSRISRVDGRVQAELDRPLRWGPLSADARLQVSQQGEQLQLRLEAPAAVLSHPLLATEPLPPAPLALEGTWHPKTGQLDADLRFGGLRAVLSGQLQPVQRHAELQISMEDAELADIVALFGPLIPEAADADCAGRLGVSVAVSGPPLRWQAWPRAEGLRCEGILNDVDGLKSGTVTWKAPGAEGQPVIRRTGPDVPLWTSWQEGQALAQVFMASEDLHFPEHGGYDLEAIGEALDEAAAGDPRPRGGSTLTQQLAKNLFLDGERTLARKLRELLYALALEQALDKRHILQLYLNIVELGPDIHGVGAAADLYFAKRAGGLTDREAAFLATLLPSPRSGAERALAGRFSDARIDQILDTLQRRGWRSAEEIARARSQRLVILPPDRPHSLRSAPGG